MRQPLLVTLIALTMLLVRDHHSRVGATDAIGGGLLQKIAKCELDTLRLGSEIADVFNSLVGVEGWAERLHQDYIAEHLGFATFMSRGLHNTGSTLTKSDSKLLQERGNWIGKSVDQSPYKVLNHKWVYMFGDSTTRQVWASFAAPFQGNNFERNSKEWTRQYVSDTLQCVISVSRRSALYFLSFIRTVQQAGQSGAARGPWGGRLPQRGVARSVRQERGDVPRVWLRRQWPADV